MRRCIVLTVQLFAHRAPDANTGGKALLSGKVDPSENHYHVKHRYKGENSSPSAHR